MAGVLYIDSPVITEVALSRQHEGEDEVVVINSAVITPSGWDYLRRHRLRLTRGEAGTEPASRTPVSAQTLPPSDAESSQHGNVSAGQQLVQQGICHYPSRCYGCESEEFGSGFVEPNSCQECAVYRRASGRPDSRDCHGCNRHLAVANRLREAGGEVDELVQQIVNEIRGRIA